MPIEKQRLEFRFEAFSGLNHPQFGSPGTQQDAAHFGQITSTNINNRDLQLALKYKFELFGEYGSGKKFATLAG
jgi:hypothetical protein